MSIIHQSQMHQDHVDWNYEIAIWELDARMWRQELEALNHTLSSLKIACEEHEKNLDVHLRSVKKHQHFFQVHESRLTMVAQGGYLDCNLSALHNKNGEEQQTQRSAHARMKQYHHLIMVLAKQLNKLLEGPI